MKNKMKIINKLIVLITLMMIQLTVVACGSEKTDVSEVSSKTDNSNSEQQYVYNPENMDSVKEQFEYICSYTNVFGEKEYLFFNIADAYTTFEYGSYYTKYIILDSDINLRVGGGCLYITKSSYPFYESLGTYTDFAIQKIN